MQKASASFASGKGNTRSHNFLGSRAMVDFRLFSLGCKGFAEQGLEKMIGLAQLFETTCSEAFVPRHQVSESLLISIVHPRNGQFFQHSKCQSLGVGTPSNTEQSPFVEF